MYFLGITCPHGAVVCLLQPGEPPVSLGDFDPTTEWLWPEGAEPQITYKSEDRCFSDNRKKLQTKVMLTCSKDYQ